MALLITVSDITYKNIVGVTPSIYVEINPNFEDTVSNGVNKIKCRVDVYKDKETCDSKQKYNRLDILTISPIQSLEYASKATLEADVNESLKNKLIALNPTWEGNIQIIDLEYQTT